MPPTTTTTTAADSSFNCDTQLSPSFVASTHARVVNAVSAGRWTDVCESRAAEKIKRGCQIKFERSQLLQLLPPHTCAQKGSLKSRNPDLYTQPVQQWTRAQWHVNLVATECELQHAKWRGNFSLRPSRLCIHGTARAGNFVHDLCQQFSIQMRMPLTTSGHGRHRLLYRHLIGTGTGGPFTQLSVCFERGHHRYECSIVHSISYPSSLLLLLPGPPWHWTSVGRSSLRATAPPGPGSVRPRGAGTAGPPAGGTGSGGSTASKQGRYCNFAYLLPMPITCTAACSSPCSTGQQIFAELYGNE